MLIRMTIPVFEDSETAKQMAHELIGTPAFNTKGDVVGFVKAAWYEPRTMEIFYDAEVIELEEKTKKRRMKRFD